MTAWGLTKFQETIAGVFLFLAILGIGMWLAFQGYQSGDFGKTTFDQKFIEGQEYACAAMGAHDTFNGNSHRYCIKTYEDRNLTSLLFEFRGDAP